MTHPNNAHLKLGRYFFRLAEEVGDKASTFTPHYAHKGSSLLAGRTDITGKPGRQNLRNEWVPWALDDLSGGEGDKFFDPTNVPSHYYTSAEGNPRIPGVLRGTPGRTDVSIRGDTLISPAFAGGGGFLYMVDSTTVPPGDHPTIWQSADGETWTDYELSSGADGDPNWNRNLAVDQNGNLYVGAGGPSEITRIVRVKSDLTADVDFHLESTNPTPGPSHLGLWGLAVWENMLCGWTGVNLYVWDTGGVVPVTPTNPFGTGHDNISDPVIIADIVCAGDRVCFFTSATGNTRVYQYARTNQGSTTPVATQIFMAPGNFEAFSIAAMNGVCYVGGQMDGATVIWGISLQNYVPFLAASIRADSVFT